MPKPQKFLLTKEGLNKIKKEYRELLRLRVFKTKGESPRIFHSEDVNPEFLAYQEDLDLLETRIVDLEQVLKNSQLITSPSKDKQSIVDVGARVTVEIGGEQDEFEIVGTLEAHPSLGKISNECPVGRALLGHQVGDEVAVGSNPKTIYRIKKVKY